MSIVETEKPKELRVIRWGLILMVVGSFSVIGLQEYFHLPEHNILTTVNSGFGEITIFSSQKYSYPSEGFLYKNDTLGFQVLRPNGWETHSIDERMLPQKIGLLESKGMLDGIYIEQNHGKQFMVTVFDIDSEDFELDSFVETQISQLEVQTKVDVPIKQISDSNDWAIFAMEISSENWNYGEQVLFLKENRLFMLQYTGQSPDQLSLDKRSEYRTIIDSFELI